MIQIKKNDYVQPTEVREEVVQGICEAFLCRSGWSIFHPFSDGAYRGRSQYIIRHKRDKEFYGFYMRPFDGEEGVKFNGAEMKRAFEELIKAGYYMFRVYQYGTWMGYICHKKPYAPDCYKDGAVNVTSFDDFID